MTKKEKQKPEADRVVSVKFPPEIHEFLRMYAYSKELALGAVIRSILEDWYSEMKHQEPNLISDIAINIQYKWNQIKARNIKSKTSEAVSFDEFIEEARQEYDRLDKTTLDFIIDNIRV